MLLATQAINVYTYTTTVFGTGKMSSVSFPMNTYSVLVFALFQLTHIGLLRQHPVTSKQHISLIKFESGETLSLL